MCNIQSSITTKKAKDMKKTILALGLATTLFTSGAIAATDIELANSIRDKFTSVAKYSLSAKGTQQEGDVMVVFNKGEYAIIKSGNEILDRNAAQIARKTLLKMTDEEKAVEVTVPLYFRLIKK